MDWKTCEDAWMQLSGSRALARIVVPKGGTPAGGSTMPGSGFLTAMAFHIRCGDKQADQDGVMAYFGWTD